MNGATADPGPAAARVSDASMAHGAGDARVRVLDAVRVGFPATGGDGAFAVAPLRPAVVLVAGVVAGAPAGRRSGAAVGPADVLRAIAAE
ncbi:hypothetical protein VSR01_36750 [Actinacidiphila sp. DG2A-62]|uniref:hypothetical protein n=1 Tax=Actinacidiphila sp. DG2A-62 TaxID=3108821 RepID=UPI002DBA230C|nr:hypothetical protein [Actinacidiphila sp. DG2A-62]MEC3998740.1 hypothetical protein [Actinacidiphila sp. DG2A-62]